jgi:hypothetical protein
MTWPDFAGLLWEQILAALDKNVRAPALDVLAAWWGLEGTLGVQLLPEGAQSLAPTRKNRIGLVSIGSSSCMVPLVPGSALL